MIDHKIAEEIALGLTAAAEKVAEEYAEGDIGDEDDFSSQLCGRLKEKIDNAVFTGDIAPPAGEHPGRAGEPGSRRRSVRLRARHLTSRGPGAEEPKIGADIVMVLDIDLPEFQNTKGILIQAKRLERDKRFTHKEADRLRGQCEDMLKLTPASYVFMYATDGVTPFSANSVFASRLRTPYQITTYPLKWFFHDFAICWIGDNRIQAADQNSMKAFLEQHSVPNGLLFSASEVEDDGE